MTDMPNPCFWEETYEGEYWHTTCGNDFVLMAGTPGENGMKFCPYCGGHLYEKESNHE